MARENRRENRKAAKEILEGENANPTATKLDAKAANTQQLDFFDQTSKEGIFSSDEDEDNEDNFASAENDDNENDDETNGEAEGVVKAAPVPNVESEKKGAAEEVIEGEVDDDEQELEIEGVPAKPVKEAAPTSEVKEPAAVVTETAAAKEPVPAPKPAEVKKEAEAPIAEAKPGVLSNEEAAQLYTEWRGQTEDLLANHHYRLDEAAVAELNENPAAYIPKLMSKVYMDSISAAFQQFTQYLPRMVGQVIEQRNNMNAAETAFFNKWPDLADKRDTVMRLGQAYRSSNPSASMDEFINEVGAQAMVALRLMPVATQANSANGKDKKPTSFKPAVESPAKTPSPVKSTNPFENLMDEFTMSEEDMDEN